MRPRIGRARNAALLVAVMALMGGCMQPVAPAPASTANAPVYSPPSFDETTGALDGLVISADLLPVANATVALHGTDRVSTSDGLGRFGFSLVAPGMQDLAVSAEGYESGTGRIEIRTGAVATISVTLDRLPSTDPYRLTTIKSATFTGYCVGLPVVGCASAVSGSGRVDFPNVASWAGLEGVVAELTWKPGTSLGDQLEEDVGLLGKAGIVGGHATGRSPLQFRWNATGIEASYDKAKVPPPDRCGQTPEKCHFFVAAYPRTDLGLTAYYDQRIDSYLTIFYYEALPALFTALPDG